MSYKLKTEDLTFYSAWYCPFAQRTWAVLEHLGLPYNYVEVDPYNKSADWLELSRGTGQVPVLKYRDHEGAVTYIPDSLRTMDFLAQLQRSKPEFITASATGSAEIHFWADQLGRAIIPYFYRFLKADLESQQSNKAKSSMTSGIESFTKAMSDNGPFFLSDQPAFVDFAFAPFALRIELLLAHYKGFQLATSGDLARRYVEWWAAMKSVPAFVKTMPQRGSYSARLLEFYLPYSTGGGQEDVVG